MPALLELLPALLLLYGAFWWGRRTAPKAKDPLPVLRAAREVVVAEQVGGTARDVAVKHLELALDEWDLKRLD